MKPSFSFFTIALCFSLTFAQNYNIIRRPPQTITLKNGEEDDEPDLVRIPSSLCYNNGNTECPLMDGTSYSACQCVCGKTDSLNLFYKSTFGFYNGSWKCEKNSALRRRSGCQLSLDMKSLENPILTVQATVDDNAIHLISNVTTIDYLNIPEKGTCSIIAENSMYLTCFGGWKSLDSTLVTKRFHVNYIENWPGKNVQLQVSYKEGSNSTHPLPSGRIIKLAVTCSNRPWDPSQCILLKIEGSLECLVTPPSHTSTPAQPPVVHPTFMPLLTPTTSPSRKPGGNIGAPNKDSSMVLDTSVIIGVSLSGLAVLAALIILLLFIIRLRKRRFVKDRKASTTECGRLAMQEEPVYTLPGSTINESNRQQDEPFYHVLEEPRPYGTQEYEMHERLQPDEAPHVYGTFNELHQTSPSDDPRGYSNTLYDSVEDINKHSK